MNLKADFDFTVDVKRLEEISMYQIQEVKGRQIVDSRGNPTVEAEVILKNGVKEEVPAQAGLLQEFMRHMSCGMVAKSTWEKALPRRWKIYTRQSAVR